MAENQILLLAKLRAQIASLDDAIASGVLRVEDGDGGSLTYQRYTDMRVARSDLAARISDLERQIVGVAPRRTRQVVTVGRSGW